MALFPTVHSERLAPGSFQQPVPIPQPLPGAEPLVTVCFNKDWLPYILGALTQLALSTTWQASDQAELDQIFGEVNNLILIFQQALAGCQTQNPGFSGAGDDFMLRQNPDNPCELQTSVDGTNWCTWADLSKCSGQPVQPGKGSVQPPSGECTKYLARVDLGSRWMLPNNVSTGDVITVTNAVGTWATPLDLFIPRCPDGNLFFEVGCVSGTGHTEGTDPAPAINHDSLIAFDGTNYYDCGPASDNTPVVITIPGGINKANLFFLGNTPDTGAFGTVEFDVQYCNNQAASWTQVLDFTSSNWGFVQDTASGICGRGHWVPGTGWVSDWCYQSGDNESFRGIVIERLGLAPFGIVTAQAYFDLTISGSVLGGTTGLSVNTSNGGVTSQIDELLSAMSSGTGQVAFGSNPQSGQTAMFAILQSGSMTGNSDPGGSCTLTKIIVSGTGTNPFVGP